MGVVGVRDRAGTVKRPSHPVQSLLGSPSHWGAVVRPTVQLIRQDHVSVTAVHILRPERGIPARTHLQIEFLAYNYLFRLF